MTTKNQTATNMGQVIDRVNELIELAKRKEITTGIDDKTAKIRKVICRT